ncbi:High affinity copper uptake protein [Dirofilaria immitis]
MLFKNLVTVQSSLVANCREWLEGENIGIIWSSISRAFVLLHFISSSRKMMNHYNGVNYAINDANISAHVEHSMHMPHDHTLTSHMHSMSFHFGYNETVLFSFWITSSPIELIMACFLTIFMCFIMESIRWFRGIRPPHNVDLHMEQSAVVSIKFAPHITTAMCKDTILHAVQLIVSYVLMLLFMTFNIWICSATVFGEVLARLFFAVAYSGNQIGKRSRVDVGCCN